MRIIGNTGGSGGGAKHVVLASDELSSDTNINNGAAYEDIGLDLTFTADGTSDYFLCTQGLFRCTANGAHNAYIRMLLDGVTATVLTVAGSNVSTDYMNFTLRVPLVDLSSGEHTLKLQASTTANFEFNGDADDGRCKAFIEGPAA